jgi:citrate synthase
MKEKLIKLDSLSDKLLREVEKNTYIDPALYDEYSVKRGLRNANGTGVLVGITKVASVDGYEIIDGQKIATEGRLSYRGISIEEMINNFQKENRFGFEETIFLLLFGSLPSRKDLDAFETILRENRKFSSDFTQDVLLKLPSKNVMNKLQRAILSMYSYDDNAEDITLENNIMQSLNIISKLPMMIAYSFQMMKHYYEGRSLVIHNPLDNSSTAENMLHLMRGDGEFTDIEAKLLDLCLIVHADHGGGNNSAFATHVVSSTGTDIYSALSTAIGSLKGPKHGGANHKVESMKDDIRRNCNYNDKAELENYLRKILNKQVFDGKGLIYGMGHAVYTISDPRTTILKKMAGELAEKKGSMEEFELLHNIENISKKIFKEESDKPICANVDLYSGFVYKILGIEEELYTPMFALARMAGWCAHRLEQIRDEKIIRPAYVSNINVNTYIPISERKNIMM